MTAKHIVLDALRDGPKRRKLLKRLVVEAHYAPSTFDVVMHELRVEGRIVNVPKPGLVRSGLWALADEQERTA